MLVISSVVLDLPGRFCSGIRVLKDDGRPNPQKKEEGMGDRFLVPVEIQGEVWYIDPVERCCRKTGKALVRAYRTQFDVKANIIPLTQVRPYLDRAEQVSTPRIRHRPGQQWRLTTCMSESASLLYPG